MLGAVEVKKAQSDGTAVILKAAYQTSAAAKHYITGLYMAFDHGAGKGLNAADRRNLGFVNVAERQVKQEILNRGDAHFLEFLAELRTNAAQALYADLFDQLLSQLGRPFATGFLHRLQQAPSGIFCNG